MRLLKRLKDGVVELTEHPPEDIPAYAILSHTWGHKDHEVTLCDIQQGAAADGLEYFWVDTCCIDKSSSAELQEAITSMFRWYQKATKCYVYLSDVVSQDEQQTNLPQATWEAAFRKSRTLQELLAPQFVEFFSRDGKKLGDRVSLDQILYKITGIAIEALKGAELFNFSIEQCLSWSKCRETTRAEDKAYSLFGIFDVSTFVNYGEGGDKAMDRLLREIGRPLGSLGKKRDRNGVITEDSVLESLNFLLRDDHEKEISPNAPKTFGWIFNSQNSPFPGWLKAERSQVETETTTDTPDATKSGLFWIKGKPGCGKSTLMKYIQGQPSTKFLLGKWARKGSILRASYYFWYGGTKLQQSQEGMLRSILYGCLADRRELIPIITHDLARARPEELSNYWNLRRLKETLKRVLSWCGTHRNSQTGGVEIKFCFFIDGLDEYDGDHEELAKFVVEVSRMPHVKLCVSSRPLNAFERELGSGLFPRIVLQERISNDIRRYVEERFASSLKMRQISSLDPTTYSKLTKNITQKASGVFVWVVLVVKLLLEGAKNGYSASQLEDHLDSYPDEIDALYQLIIGRVHESELRYCFRYLRFVEVTGGTISLLLLTFADILLDETSIPKDFNDKIQLQGARDRINSSCLGLLEIGGKQRTKDEKLAEASVVFLHKSVFDYLKTNGARQQFKKFESISIIIPERKLIEATLLLLQTRYPNPKPLGRPIWFSSIQPHAMTFLRLARDMEEKDGTCELELADKLDEKVTKLWRFVRPQLPEEQDEDIHWVWATRTTREMAAYLAESGGPTERMPTNYSPKHGKYSFVRYTHRYGLRLHANEKGFVDTEKENISRGHISKTKEITNIPHGPKEPVHVPQDIHQSLPCVETDVTIVATAPAERSTRSADPANISHQNPSDRRPGVLVPFAVRQRAIAQLEWLTVGMDVTTNTIPDARNTTPPETQPQERTDVVASVLRDYLD